MDFAQQNHRKICCKWCYWDVWSSKTEVYFVYMKIVDVINHSTVAWFIKNSTDKISSNMDNYLEKNRWRITGFKAKIDSCNMSSPCDLSNLCCEQIPAKNPTINFFSWNCQKNISIMHFHWDLNTERKAYQFQKKVTWHDGALGCILYFIGMISLQFWDFFSKKVRRCAHEKQRTW